LPSSAPNHEAKGRDWRIYLGLAVSLIWLLLGFLYINQSVGWSNFADLPAEQMGSFLEGAFAPLAFFWLVIGYFLQQEELQQNTAALNAQAREIERSAEQASIQSEKMAESELHARQEAFLRIAQNVKSQLGAIAGFLFISSQGAANEDGSITREEQSALFTQLNTVDTEVFSRRLLELNLATLDLDERYKYFYGTPVRARHCNNFIYAFDRLMRRAEKVDTENMIADALRASGHGLIYQVMQRHRERAPEELADISKTGRGINI